MTPQNEEKVLLFNVRIYFYENTNRNKERDCNAIWINISTASTTNTSIARCPIVSRLKNKSYHYSKPVKLCNYLSEYIEMPKLAVQLCYSEFFIFQSFSKFWLIVSTKTASSFTACLRLSSDSVESKAVISALSE